MAYSRHYRAFLSCLRAQFLYKKSFVISDKNGFEPNFLRKNGYFKPLVSVCRKVKMYVNVSKCLLKIQTFVAKYKHFLGELSACIILHLVLLKVIDRHIEPKL